ncbi:MAG: T9SS type A sorting domain-containing protein [Paludibacteraceae bacterium]|nr:T9SS type A sorting domain-containing protein [Paludibacteraceae bacterium]
MYGRMRTQEVQSMNEQISTIGLPQGVYVILLKENGSTIAQTKVITQ